MLPAGRGPCTEQQGRAGQLELNIPSDLHLLVGFTRTLHIGLIRLWSLHVAGCLLGTSPSATTRIRIHLHGGASSATKTSTISRGVDVYNGSSTVVHITDNIYWDRVPSSGHSLQLLSLCSCTSPYWWICFLFHG